VDNYKKSIIKEQERNEELTLMLNKLNADIEHVMKQVESSVAKKEALKVEFMTYTRTLQETEQSLARANTVSHITTLWSTCIHVMYTLYSLSLHVHGFIFAQYCRIAY